MRRAARVDANQAWIVEALEKVGARVYWIKEPVDLLVGFRGETILLEVKNPARTSKKPDSRMTPAQIEFRDKWNGGRFAVVETLDEVYAAVLGQEAMK